MQLSDIKARYADEIVDNMDIKTLAQMAYDVILENLESYTEEELKAEIEECYGEEVVAEYFN